MSGEELRALAEAATPGEWSYNGYSGVMAAGAVDAHDAFWTEERLNDGHSYDHRVGQTCPACGERPAVYGDDALPEFRGKRFGTYWDCAFNKDAYDVEPWVASVPAQYGDTATGRHAADAAFIAAANPTAVLALLDERDALRAQVAVLEACCDSEFERGEEFRAQVERVRALAVIPERIAEHDCFKSWCPHCAQRKTYEAFTRAIRDALDPQ